MEFLNLMVQFWMSSSSMTTGSLDTNGVSRHTSYVSTRWYRAPECILRSHHYNFNSDIFAAGCVMAELYLGHPLFPGSSELDQIDKVF